MITFITAIPTKLIKSSIAFNNLTVSRRSIMENACMMKCIKACIPSLDSGKHKGQAGRIGIIGGSMEYTGAPYFAGISALKVGADLVHIFCASTAATVIKSYSPELIVHPLLDVEDAINHINPWLDRLHAIVIGPGLGRETETLNVVSKLIETIRKKQIPLVVDADGLFLITDKPALIQDFTSPVILTPNKIEFERICNKLNGTSGINKLGPNVIILRKGSTDEVLSTSDEVQWELNTGGSGRRCGGQGDLLSGSIATFLNWTLANVDNIEIDIKANKATLAASLSCYAGARLIRLCNEKAFKSRGRSMLASDMTEHIHEAFEELFGL